MSGISRIFHPKFLIFNIQEDALLGPILNRFSRAAAHWKAVYLYFVRKWKNNFAWSFSLMKNHKYAIPGISRFGIAYLSQMSFKNSWKMKIWNTLFGNRFSSYSSWFVPKTIGKGPVFSWFRPFLHQTRCWIYLRRAGSKCVLYKETQMKWSNLAKIVNLKNTGTRIILYNPLF